MSTKKDLEQGCRDCPQLLLEGQLCFPLYAAARKVISVYTPLLKPLGLTYTQYIVFLALWENGKVKVRCVARSLTRNWRVSYKPQGIAMAKSVTRIMK